MRYTFLHAAAFIAVASAATFDIAVGENGIRFEPNSTTANTGDTLVFHFYEASGPHSVVFGPFDSPCQPSDNAIYSGFIPGDSNGDSTFTVQVASTDPMYYYCSLARHCQGGMVGVINPASSGNTLEQYAAAAQSASAASEPSSAEGGVVASGSSTSGGASATGSSSASSTSSGTGAVVTSASSSASSAISSASSRASSAASSAASRASSAVASATGTSAAGKVNNVGGVLGAVGGLAALLL